MSDENKSNLPEGDLQYSYQKLIFFLNRRCPVGCASCNAAASNGSRGELTPGWLVKFFNRIGQQELKFSRHVIWTGGEPFLSFAALKSGIELASGSCYCSEILTSGTWFDGNPGYLEQLLAEGDFSLRVSLDAEHQEKVPLELVFNLIERALRHNIEVNFTLRRIPGRRESVEYYVSEIKQALPGFYRLNHTRPRWLHIIPHIPVLSKGLADAAGKSVSFPGHRKWQKACQQGFRDLVIGEDGLVYPCCGLFTLSCYPRLAIGNPLQETLRSLFGKQTGNPLLRLLKDKGPYHICRELGYQPETWSWPPFQNPCSLCLALFSRHADEVLSYYSE